MKNSDATKFEERLDQFLCNKLSQDQIDELWVEIIEDPVKYEYVKTSAALYKQFYEAGARDTRISGTIGKPKVKLNRTAIWKNTAVAAGIALALGLISVFTYNSVESPGISPLSSLEFANLRSAGDVGLTELEADIQTAINAALSGETSNALVKLSRVIDLTADKSIRASALINSGIIEYNQDNFEAATRHFEQVLKLDMNDVLVTERAAWYLAQSQLAQGDNQAAREALTRVVEIDGAHSRMAASYLRYLR